MISDADAILAPLGKVGLVSVDMGGGVRLWETGLESLQRSLQDWRNMIGQEDGRPVQVGIPNLKWKTFSKLMEMTFPSGQGRDVLKNVKKWKYACRKNWVDVLPEK